MFKNPNESGCMKWECSGTLMLMAFVESRREGACVIARHCKTEFPHVGRRRDSNSASVSTGADPWGGTWAATERTRGRS
jgi:hypothetical protein